MDLDDLETFCPSPAKISRDTRTPFHGTCRENDAGPRTSGGTTTMKFFSLSHGFFLLLCWVRSCDALAGWRTAATPIAAVHHGQRPMSSIWAHARQRRRCVERETEGGRKRRRVRARVISYMPSHHLLARGLSTNVVVCLFEHPICSHTKSRTTAVALLVLPICYRAKLLRTTPCG